VPSAECRVLRETRKGNCPTDCGRSRAIGNLMCPVCWHLVPLELQRPVWVAWRQLNKARDKGYDARAVLTLAREHQQASDEAITYVKQRISQKELFA